MSFMTARYLNRLALRGGGGIQDFTHAGKFNIGPLKQKRGWWADCGNVFLYASDQPGHEPKIIVDVVITHFKSRGKIAAHNIEALYEYKAPKLIRINHDLMPITDQVKIKNIPDVIVSINTVMAMFVSGE